MFSQVDFFPVRLELNSLVHNPNPQKNEYHLRRIRTRAVFVTTESRATTLALVSTSTMVF
jgi:hypothetical protein